MEIKLCYKSYPAKMSLGAIKQFKRATGKDLWYCLIHFLEVYHSSLETEVLGRMRQLYDVIDFETAAQAFYALIKSENKSIPLEEIEDAMFRVGWMPIERHGDMGEPWPLVMAIAAIDVNTDFSEMVSEKKAATLDRSEKT